MRLSADETVAYVNFSYSGLTGGNTLTDWHVHNDPYLSSGAGIIFDGVEPVTPGDGLVTSGPYAGSHKWTIEAVGGLSANDIRELIKQLSATVREISIIEETANIEKTEDFQRQIGYERLVVKFESQPIPGSA